MGGSSVWLLAHTITTLSGSPRFTWGAILIQDARKVKDPTRLNSGWLFDKPRKGCYDSAA
jgi:hypothetical protein